MRVGEPAADGDGVLGVEDVGCGRVVDDDCFSEIATDLREVLRVSLAFNSGGLGLEYGP